MLPFYVLVLIIVFGFIVNYMVMVRHVKNLRDPEVKRFNKYEIAACGIFFGGPVLLFSYVFKEIRDEDMFDNHYLYLISGIVLTIIQIVAAVLLVYFDVFTFTY